MCGLPTRKSLPRREEFRVRGERGAGWHDGRMGPTLPPDLRLGPVHITLTDLARSIPSSQDSIGLQLHGRDDGTAAMGAGRDDLVFLVENPPAPPAGRHAGLYHY